MWSCGIFGVTARGTAGPQRDGDDAQDFGAHRSKTLGDCREEVSHAPSLELRRCAHLQRCGCL